MSEYKHHPGKPTYEAIDTGERRQVGRNSAEHVAIVRERLNGQSHRPRWIQIPDQPKEQNSEH